MCIKCVNPILSEIFSPSPWPNPYSQIVYRCRTAHASSPVLRGRELYALGTFSAHTLPSTVLLSLRLPNGLGGLLVFHKPMRPCLIATTTTTATTMTTATTAITRLPSFANFSAFVLSITPITSIIFSTVTHKHISHFSSFSSSFSSPIIP